MKNKDYKGLWIPLCVMEDGKLTPSEKMLFSIIINLSENHSKGCIASNAYLAAKMGFSSRRIQQILSALKTKGFITTRNIFQEGTNRVSQRVMKISSGVSRKDIHIDNKEDKKVYIEKNKRLNDIFYDFIVYRKELNKPLGETSLKANAQKLLQLSDNSPEKARTIIKQTIEKGWLNLYELKGKINNSGNSGLAEGKILRAGGYNDYSNLGF